MSGVHVMVISLIHPHKWLATLAFGVMAFALAGSSVEAQAPPPAAAQKESCDASEAAKPATPAEKDAASGSKNMGATGWSGGGLGGSHTGTSHAGPTPDSRTAQPETAKGLDPTQSERTASAEKCDK